MYFLSSLTCIVSDIFSSLVFKVQSLTQFFFCIVLAVFSFCDFLDNFVQILKELVILQFCKTPAETTCFKLPSLSCDDGDDEEVFMAFLAAIE